MPDSDLPQRIAAVRRFNRFYTQRIGVLQEGWLKSPFSLAEARVLYELIHREQSTASEIGRDLALDAGYLSRILRGFERRGLVKRQASKTDGRQSLLSVTAAGRQAFDPIEAHTSDEVAAMLGRLPAAGQARLIDALHTVEDLLRTEPAPQPPYLLRPPQPGDMGWVVSRHGVFYAREYRWDEQLEALCAEIVANFVRSFDAKRERCWIVEREGENVGCVFLVQKSQRLAQLRLLLVEPKARGLGIGARLVDECIRFARAAGYHKITLWTHSVLTIARHIYEQAGFKRVAVKRHREFGQELVGETWDLKL